MTRGNQRENDRERALKKVRAWRVETLARLDKADALAVQ